MLTSQELYEKIDALRRQKGMKISELNAKAGISNGTLPSWKQRGTMPKLEILESLCVALESPLGAILFDVDAEKLTGEETELITLWRQLDEKQHTAILRLIKVMIEDKSTTG